MVEFYPWLFLKIEYIPLKLIKISPNNQNKLPNVILVSTAAVYGSSLGVNGTQQVFHIRWGKT